MSPCRFEGSRAIVLAIVHALYFTISQRKSDSVILYCYLSIENVDHYIVKCDPLCAN